MSRHHTDLLNYALYQAGWFAGVLGAGWGYPWAGFATAVALITVHVILTPQRTVELRLIALATITGFVVEIVQLASGTYRFPSGMMVAGVSPPWLLALWAQLATTFRYCLRGIVLRPARALLFGGLGGPIAFLAGERLGAVQFTSPLLPGLVRLSLAWLLALGIFSMAARRAMPPDVETLRYRR